MKGGKECFKKISDLTKEEVSRIASRQLKDKNDIDRMVQLASSDFELDRNFAQGNLRNKKQRFKEKNKTSLQYCRLLEIDSIAIIKAPKIFFSI